MYFCFYRNAMNDREIQSAISCCVILKKYLPVFFSSLLALFFSGVFITKGDVGVGTIVGSAVFNVLVIIGLCGIFAGQVHTRQLQLVGASRLSVRTAASPLLCVNSFTSRSR